jgi:hypothetical protein
MTQTLKEILSNVTRNSWNVMHIMEGSSKVIRQRELQKLWVDKHMTEFDPVTRASYQPHLMGCGWDHWHKGVFSG